MTRQRSRRSVACWALVVALGLATGAEAHTWLLDPPSHYQLFPRNAISNTPCDPYSIGVFDNPMKVTAGEEITVRWGAMGHAGGYVRLALAPRTQLTFATEQEIDNFGAGDGNDTAVFDRNVIKYECFGGGSCPTCVTDEESYGTQLVIPNNLVDGVYTLQLWAYGTGQALPSTYSCADLEITGGDFVTPCDPMVLPPSNSSESIDRCWSCDELTPGSPLCAKPYDVPLGSSATFGRFCFPDRPTVKAPNMKFIGFAKHELGLGDTLLGIARVFQCCCTPEDIAVYTGWSDVSNAIVEMQFQTLIAGRDVYVPFFQNRRLCTPADPADFLNAASPTALHTLVFLVVAIVSAWTTFM